MTGHGCLASCPIECKCAAVDEDSGLSTLIDTMCRTYRMCRACPTGETVGIIESGGTGCGEYSETGIHTGKLTELESLGNATDARLAGVSINKAHCPCVCVRESAVCELTGHYDVTGLKSPSYACCGEVTCVALCDDEVTNERRSLDCDCHSY